MKISITIERHASSIKKSSAIGRINRELGAKVTIKGDEIIVESYDKDKVAAILDREGLDYTVSR